MTDQPDVTTSGASRDGAGGDASSPVSGEAPVDGVGVGRSVAGGGPLGGHGPDGQQGPDGEGDREGPDGEGGRGTDATATDRRLLARARELGELDLAERPDAIAELDQAIVAELRAIEDL